MNEVRLCNMFGGKVSIVLLVVLLIILILNLLNKPFGLEHELTKRCQGEDVLFDIWLMMGDGL